MKRPRCRLCGVEPVEWFHLVTAVLGFMAAALLVGYVLGLASQPR